VGPASHSPTLPSPPLLSPHTPYLPLPSVPLEVGPSNTVKGSGEHCKLSSGVWGRAPGEIKFGAF